MNEHAFDAELSPEDAEVVDLLAEAGFDPDAARNALDTGTFHTPERVVELTPTQRRRLGRLIELFGLLDALPAEPADPALVPATMLRIERFERDRQERLRARPDRFRRLVPLPDLISVAAVLLIAASIAIPALNAIRQRSIDQQCADRLRVAASAFELYARDQAGAVPVSLAAGVASWPGLQTIAPGALVSGGYCDAGHLNCPGHPEGEPAGFGQQVVADAKSVRWLSGTGITVVLADRSPLVDAWRKGLFLPPQALSPNHGGRGQNALFVDGSVNWLRLPVVGADDNLWLPAGARILQPGSRPSAAGDAFVVH